MCNELCALFVVLDNCCWGQCSSDISSSTFGDKFSTKVLEQCCTWRKGQTSWSSLAIPGKLSYFRIRFYTGFWILNRVLSNIRYLIIITIRWFENRMLLPLGHLNKMVSLMSLWQSFWRFCLLIWIFFIEIKHFSVCTLQMGTIVNFQVTYLGSNSVLIHGKSMSVNQL